MPFSNLCGEIFFQEMSLKALPTGALCLVMLLDCLVIISLLEKQIIAQNFFL